MNPIFQREGVVVLWLDGAVLVTWRRSGILLEAPSGIAKTVIDRELASWIGTVALSGGRIQSVGGLLALLGALEPHRSEFEPLAVRFPLIDERPGLVAEAWSRGWPDRYPLTLDAVMPGDGFDADGIDVRTLPIPRGEARWIHPPVVESHTAVAWRLHAGSVTIAVVLGAQPGPHVARACLGADLAIVEIGRAPWPTSAERWRLTTADALEAGKVADVLWLVGDDGALAGQDEN